VANLAAPFLITASAPRLAVPAEILLLVPAGLALAALPARLPRRKVAA
jgi:hypothetical protein